MPMRTTPRKCSPITTIRAAAIMRNQSMWSATSCPKAEAVAPMATKIVTTPRAKHAADRTALVRTAGVIAALPPGPAEIWSIPTPAM
jgi:hypothetical protein